MKHILILNTMQDYSSDDHAFDWIGQVCAAHACARDFIFDTVRTAISENIAFPDCITIQKQLRGMDLAKYCGIVILHGTEYLVYTAAALSYLLADLHVPVALIPVNRLSGHEKNNRRECLDGAVTLLLCNEALRGTYVLLKNEADRRLEVHMGTRITQPAPFDYHFSSVRSGRYGEIADGQFRFLKHPANPDILTVRRAAGPAIFPETIADILFIKAYRHMTYHYYQFHTKKPAAVLHEIFDTKTMVAQDEISDLCRFCEACQKQDLPLYILPLNDSDGDFLADMRPVIGCGARPVTNITVASLYAKLVYGYSMKAMPALLNQNIFFEHF